MIRALIETSLVDWDGKITSVLFFDKCNFKCPFCQNWELMQHPEKFPIVTWEHICETLEKKKGWVDGVVLTGGEPLMNGKDALALARKIKKLGLAVKIDTNGAFPKVLKQMIDESLVDYVAMDIKSPLDENYDKATGRKVNLKKISESISILRENAVDYEFRTTCVPGIIDEAALEEIGRIIKGSKKWALQAFVPENADKAEYRQPLAKEYVSSMRKFANIAKKYVDNVVLRGKV